jgi:hypothetical protein
MPSPSIQDFTTIKSCVEKFKNENNLIDETNAFYFFALNLILKLQDDEINDSITDNYYLQIETNNTAGHDRGIDAIFIDENDETSVIHFFNFKYAKSFEKISSHYPANEIDKILSFLNNLMGQEAKLESEVNPILFSKVKEIWKIFEKQNPRFIFHICSNLYNDFEEQEKARFEIGINRHSHFTIEYHNINTFISALTKKDKQIVDAKIRAIDKNLFEKSDGDIRALIVNIDARDLIRIVLDNDTIRNNADLEDYTVLKSYQILEDAFEDNIRLYLKQRSKINRNIKETALSNEAHRFFYFNNGVTITCNSFSYPKTMRSAIIEIQNLQVVNGSQTIHALYDAFRNNPNNFETLDILCRIYQTNNDELSNRIAEFTNSQNPVSSRDIRSIDYIQQKLEKEFEAKGYYYERKRRQYSGQEKKLRIDAEKTGQVLLALFNEMPAEAKNKKRIIFAEKYEDIFNDNLTADKVLLAIRLFDYIEEQKNIVKNSILNNKVSKDEFFLVYASYWILYFIGSFASKKTLELTIDNFDKIKLLYPNVKKLVAELIRKETAVLPQKNNEFSAAAFFKSNRPKKIYEDMTVPEISSYLKTE